MLNFKGAPTQKKGLRIFCCEGKKKIAKNVFKKRGPQHYIPLSRVLQLLKGRNWQACCEKILQRPPLFLSKRLITLRSNPKGLSSVFPPPNFGESFFKGKKIVARSGKIPNPLAPPIVDPSNHPFQEVGQFNKPNKVPRNQPWPPKFSGIWKVPPSFLSFL